MLIHKSEGSLFFIGSIFTTLKLKDQSILETDHCGHCRACIDACPTDAIEENSRSIIVNRCISTFTIELFKEAQAPLGMEQGNGELFGCDICQDVCPWNIKLSDKLQKKETKNSRLFEFFLSRPLNEVYEEISGWSNKKYVREFKKTVVERTGRIGMLKNIKFYLK